MALAEHRAGRTAERIPPSLAGEVGTVLGDDGLARPRWAAGDPLLREYYDTEWGLPIRDEQGLYERICLEGFQAGLSWATILRKRPAFRAAFMGFNPDAVAAFTDEDVERLLQDQGIVRNRLKIRAAITNAKATIDLGMGEVWLTSCGSSSRTPLPGRPPTQRSPHSHRNQWRCPKRCASKASRSWGPPPCSP